MCEKEPWKPHGNLFCRCESCPCPAPVNAGDHTPCTERWQTSLTAICHVGVTGASGWHTLCVRSQHPREQIGKELARCSWCWGKQRSWEVVSSLHRVPCQVLWFKVLTSQSPAVLVQDNVAQSTQTKPFCNTTGQNVARYSVTFGEN